MTSWEADAANHDDESGLVDRAVSGERAAFEMLYRRHRDHIYGLVWRLAGGDAGLAEDLLQEAFVRAWQKLDSFRGDSRFATWLHRLTVNVALSDRRIRVRRLERETALEGAAERTASGAQDVYAGTNMDLEQAISRLQFHRRQLGKEQRLRALDFVDAQTAAGFCQHLG